MPSYTFDAYGFDTITTTGPDPFDSNNTGNSDSVANGSTIRIDPSAVASDLVMIDNDSTFEDGDGQQELADPLTLNGTQFSPGTSVETEYAYVIRPVGSTDPGDNITIYVLEFDGDVVGIASDKRLIPGQEYKIVSIASNDPTIAYADMAVCFLRGTLIAVPDGERAVEDIQVGDLVTTVDDGPQEVVWCGRQRSAVRATWHRSASPAVRWATTVIFSYRRNTGYWWPRTGWRAGRSIWCLPRRLSVCPVLASHRDTWCITITSCARRTIWCVQTARLRKPCCRGPRRSGCWDRWHKRKSRQLQDHLSPCHPHAPACGWDSGGGCCATLNACRGSPRWWPIPCPETTIAHSTQDASFL